MDIVVETAESLAQLKISSIAGRSSLITTVRGIHQYRDSPKRCSRRNVFNSGDAVSPFFEIFSLGLSYLCTMSYQSKQKKFVVKRYLDMSLL